MAEDDPLVGRFIVDAVVEAFGGGGAVIEHEDLSGDPAVVIAIGHDVSTHGGDNEPEAIDGFMAFKGDDGEGTGAGESEGEESEMSQH